MSQIKKECTKDACEGEIVVDLPCGPTICIQTKACEGPAVAEEAPKVVEKQ